LSFVSLADLGSKGEGNDIWGWTDPITGREYAVVCVTDGTSFVDVSNPEDPIVLGFMPTATRDSIWRDAKVYKNYAFVVSEALDHGMQIFDLTRLRGMSGSFTVPTLTPDALYVGFGSSHNIVINEETGFAYSVGTKTCQGGLHIVNIQDPLNPECAGCYWQDGYVHDAQCVIYNGPDAEYVGREICFMYDEDTLTIVDVTSKTNMVELSRKPYQGSQYTHQGWLTEDHKYLFLNDELDEQAGTTAGPESGRQTRTLIWDVTTLTNPSWVNSFWSEELAIDHNLYVKGNFVYESNYCAGLRVLEFSEIPIPQLTQVGYFDVAPDCNNVLFEGTWSNFPYFESGTVVVNSIERGLFVLRVNLP
jgi:choice-of-anchor B domain-containing protein